MLSSIKFKFGAAPGKPALEVPTPPSVTIFVGPNNSGKSQALREIRNIFSHANSQPHVVEQITFSSFTELEAQAELDAITDKPRNNEVVQAGVRFVKLAQGRGQVRDQAFIQGLQNPNENRHQFTSQYAERCIVSLDGPSRIHLVNPQSRGDLKYPESMLARLLTDDERRKSLRNIIFEATNLMFVIDASVGDHLHVRFGETEPPNERTYSEETLEYMRQARAADDVSDGIKAFAGILLQLHAGTPKVFVVDEPEAFLHPSLAFKLGKELSRGAVDEGKHVFASTHSAHFLMGAITSGATVNIIRLTYSGGVGTARLLQSNDLRLLMQDPLLRSVGVLEGLFYDYVVVGEGNADRAFYQEVNERLLSCRDKRGLPHALFLNADNKQTIPRILTPLRQLGIPAAGIVDLDVLKDGGSEWTKQLNAVGMPSGEHDAYANRRSTVLKSLMALDKDFKRDGGLNLLAGAEAETAWNLLLDLRRNGLFVVPRGEVENWLSDLNVERSKNGWLRDIFERMGSDPRSREYITPGDGDVWDFLGEIVEWMMNPNRRGIPS
ncbi:ATP-binding protein [Rhizobium leguminosarum bv. viciae]|uniref:ATP-dependent nuclease n=1 Tax=Rhizobium leguminosarum TaxID=384 RepID=UPI00103D9238|nr:ATP-binding protein [Rhizobium leguminosarum]MBY5341456.1 AAA family ATPase [Rhizobium leguminosarum]NKK51144.1 AAA family ATPase [Rhizobium leguminosarum bv. viciae]TBY99888.1 ATP-binding protein [Rhizobium leguminosarum bv. viciae]